LRQYRLHPTKALVASAYAARIARRAAEYGVVIGGDIGIDMRRVKARKDATVAALRRAYLGPRFFIRD
jgi:pyruvate/2-oxoglutarate dehydrogenase complex dihydrolipoamide dehydrogenase (E3) component